METVMDMMDVFAAVYQSSLENTIQAIQLKLQSDPDAKDLVSWEILRFVTLWGPPRILVHLVLSQYSWQK